MAEFTSYEAGTPCWVDLGSPDLEASKAFYGGLFGWDYDDQPIDENTTYSMAKVGGRSAAVHLHRSGPAQVDRPPAGGALRYAADAPDHGMITGGVRARLPRSAPQEAWQ